MYFLTLKRFPERRCSAADMFVIPPGYIHIYNTLRQLQGAAVGAKWRVFTQGEKPCTQLTRMGRHLEIFSGRQPSTPRSLKISTPSSVVVAHRRHTIPLFASIESPSTDIARLPFVGRGPRTLCDRGYLAEKRAGWI